MRVVLFYRKRHEGNFSIENLFKQICQAFPKEVAWETKELSFYSKGLLRRYLIGMEAMLNQRGINHITGDINFIAIFLRKRHTILTIHDVGYMKNRNPIARLILLWFWIRWPVRRSSIIAVVSHATKDELLKYVWIHPAKIKVIHVPFSPLFESTPKEFNKKEPVILQVGTKLNKNLTRLIHALKDIPCKLEIIGNLTDSIVKELKENKINYQSSANLTEQEIVMKYKTSDIVSFVSTYEGFGIPILEGNSVGRVVVTSNTLSMPEVAGDSAHLVDPFDVDSIRCGFLKVIDDDIYREELIRIGFINKDRFKVEKIAQQYVEIYKSFDE